MFHRIVVGFDGTTSAQSALAFAVTLGAPDATITVAAVAVERIETGLATGIDALTGLPRNDDALLAEARDLLGHRSGVAYETHVGSSVGNVLDRLATEHAADLLVVGSSHHHGLRRALSGSDAEDALHGATCAVCIVPARDGHPIRRIGVAFDGSNGSRPAVDVAATLAGQTRSALSVVTVVDTAHPFDSYAPGGDLAHHGRHLLNAEVARVETSEPPHAILTEGDPTSRLLSTARDLDLLVLGGRSHGPVLRRLLGSVADEVVRLSPCPVLVVPELIAGAPVAAVERPALVRRGVSW